MSDTIKMNLDAFSIQKGFDYIDVQLHHTEGWMELKIESTDSFPIESQEELDFIYEKLTEAFKSLKQ
jgi:2-oxoglutarate dehydrogenase complex dehydrogenase (E1) component-like enzyme